MRTWAAVAAGGAGLLAARLAYARRHRILHPRGRSFAAEVHLWGLPGEPTGVHLLDRPARHRATVRLSKGTPTPTGWPDILGIAVRLHDVGPTGVFDLLLSTTGPGRILEHVPAPRRGFASRYGSILALHAAHDRWYLAALPDPESAPLGDTLDTVAAAAADGRASLLLAARRPHDSWQPYGRLRLGEPLNAAEEAALAFDPTRHQAPGLHPAGAVQALRGLTYRLSQRWRGVQSEPTGPAVGQTVTAAP